MEVGCMRGGDRVRESEKRRGKERKRRIDLDTAFGISHVPKLKLTTCIYNCNSHIPLSHSLKMNKGKYSRPDASTLVATITSLCTQGILGCFFGQFHEDEKRKRGDASQWSKTRAIP